MRSQSFPKHRDVPTLIAFATRLARHGPSACRSDLVAGRLGEALRRGVGDGTSRADLTLLVAVFRSVSGGAEAARWVERLIGHVPLVSPELADLLVGLCETWGERSEGAGAEALAARLARSATERPEAAIRAGAHHALASAAVRRADAADDDEAAVRLYREAALQADLGLAAAPSDSLREARADALAGIGESLDDDAAMRDAAEGLEAVARGSLDAEVRARAFTNAGYLWGSVYEAEEDPVMLDRMVAALEQAVALDARAGSEDVSTLLTLGYALNERAERDGSESDAARSAAVSRRAQALAPSDPGPAVNLGVACALRADLGGDLVWLDGAIEAYDHAVSLGGEFARSELAQSLADRYDLARSPPDLRRAVREAGLALRGARGTPDEPRCASVLGAVLLRRADAEEDDGRGRQRAERLLRDALAHGERRPTEVAHTLSNLATSLSTRARRESNPGLATEARAVAERALALLHGSTVGRAVVSYNAADAARAAIRLDGGGATPVARAYHRAIRAADGYPEIQARSWLDLAAAAYESSDWGGAVTAFESASEAVTDAVARHGSLRHQLAWSGLTGDVASRALLAGLRAGDVRRAVDVFDRLRASVLRQRGLQSPDSAPDVPVVVVAPDDAGGAAVIVWGESRAVVPLDVFRTATLQRLAAGARGPTRALGPLVAGRARAVAGPVLDPLGRADVVAVVASGLAEGVPVAAAFTRAALARGRDETAFVTWPSIAAPSPAACPDRGWIVPPPDPSEIPDWERERAAILGAVPSAVEVVPATVRAVGEAVAAGPFVHVATHGWRGVTPAENAVDLADGVLDVAAVLDLPPFAGGRGLAVLAACDSAASTTDDTLSLATALLTRGYGGVVATQLPVKSRPLQRFLRAFYRGVGGGLEPVHAFARALRYEASRPSAAALMGSAVDPGSEWCALTYVGR